MAKVDRTVIIVAHRLSTLRQTARILVLSEGQIVEAGTYDELLGQGGVFTQLVLHAEDAIAANLSGAIPRDASP